MTVGAAANAQNSVEAAASHAQTSEDYSNLSKSYAVGTGGQVRENDGTDNARFYSEQARQVAEGLKGALIPMGTVFFEGLPDTSTAGYMYNISDGFTTTDRFKEGAGHAIPAGANVYYTTDGYWDVLAGTPVVGVKGAAETDYQQGYINLTPENIGALTSANVVNNNTITVAGYALDARQANPNIAGSLGAQINAANTALATHKTSGDHDDRYVRRDNVRYYSAGEALTTTVNSNVSTTVGKLSIAYAGRYIVRATILTTCPVIDRPWEVYAQFANADTGQVSGVSKILVPASMSTTIVINLDTYTLYELGAGTNLDVRLYQTSGQALTIQGYVASVMRFT